MTAEGDAETGPTVDGYRGIWFALGQFDGEYGDKYAGGLATYAMKHVPTAVYAPDADRTFFTYGGARRSERDLLVMAGSYDHSTGEVTRPTVVDEKPEPDRLNGTNTVVDPHDNASLAVAEDGHVWVFVSGRGRHRPGRLYRSTAPHSVATFEQVDEREFAYPQPWVVDGTFCHCFTRYTPAGERELFWETSRDGRTWSTPRKLAGFGGHYAVSEERDGVVHVAFTYHPEGDADRRTNLYVIRTRDAGATWELPDGTVVDPPLETPDSPALAVNYRTQGRLVYLKDLAVDGDGNPAVLHLTSGGPAPGPGGDPRRWRIACWTGDRWRTHTVTTSDHNYDSGSLYVGEEAWLVAGPTDPGPQPYHTGGAVAVWRSTDRGERWERTYRFATHDGRNATYVRRPRNATPPFTALWADGNAARPSESRLYVADVEAGRCFRLPAGMDGDRAVPERVE